MIPKICVQVVISVHPFCYGNLLSVGLRLAEPVLM
jgi:hypothetical protein